MVVVAVVVMHDGEEGKRKMAEHVQTQLTTAQNGSQRLKNDSGRDVNEMDIFSDLACLLI